MGEELIFVYNANSDLFSAVSDFAHKILSPSTYSCQLCALTYGNLTVKEEWKTFVQKLPMPAVFLHKDEFEKRYKVQADLPAVFVLTSGEIKELITKQEIDNCRSLRTLEDLVSEKLKIYAQHHHPNIQ